MQKAPEINVYAMEHNNDMTVNDDKLACMYLPAILLASKLQMDLLVPLAILQAILKIDPYLQNRHVFFQKLFIKCRYLRKILIFRYCGIFENQLSLQQ